MTFGRFDGLLSRHRHYWVLYCFYKDTFYGVSGLFALWQFAMTKSIGPMCICCSLSLRKRNKHGKTVTAHVESKVN